MATEIIICRVCYHFTGEADITSSLAAGIMLGVCEGFLFTGRDFATNTTTLENVPL